jgi:CRISPR-associated endonuclease/helicase Cas3
MQPDAFFHRTTSRTIVEPDFFSLAFKALTDNDPLRWQKRLYNQMRAGNLPVICDLPTGLGKTSVIPIWLIAFASQIEAGEAPRLPRRLIYIVNRRTVVDQATATAERLRRRILGYEAVAPNASKPLERLREALERARAVSTGEPIAISTLRGELADNEEWKADPARPAIIVGTIDMIGSKLLFSGYGDGFRMRPHHAGLIGQDTLIVHDEAHLTPAFSRLLWAVAGEQRKSKEPRPIHVLELSATTSSVGNGPVLSLEREDEDDAVVSDRLKAQKSLLFCTSDDLEDRIAELAWKHHDKTCKVLVYVRSPEMAQEIVRNLKGRIGAQAEERVALLTGTIRGYERDRLVKEHPVYRALLQHDLGVTQTVYLVSTAAGEVGIDLDADQMICDLTTLDRMVQRLGRVNRRGGPDRVAQIDVVVEVTERKGKEPTPIEQAEATTRSALDARPKREDGGYDASPSALRTLLAGMNEDLKQHAFAPQPAVAPVTDILLDAWTMTSVREALPGRPEVAPYLHGLTADPPETHIVWRSEVKLLAEANTSQQVLRRWFGRCRIEARERLRDRTDRVVKEIQKIAKRHSHKDLQAVVLTERGEAELLPLLALLERSLSELAFRTVILPVEAGGLTNEGLLDGDVHGPAMDVADVDGKRARQVIRAIGNMYWHWPITDYKTEEIETDDLEDGQTCTTIEEAAAQIARSHSKVVSQLIPLVHPPEGGEDEAEIRYLLLMVEPKRAAEETPESAGFAGPPTLNQHSEDAAAWAERIADALCLEEALKQTLITAARWHDRGKARRCWQRAIFNETNAVLAKPGPRGMNPRLLGGYRHEFGSLLEAAADSQVCSHLEADLILHLIAAHHGRARPHFESDAWDMERHTTVQNTQAAHEVMRRFGRLQQRFGRWGLAWLESLLRCADALASQQVAEKGISHQLKGSEV